MCRTAASVPERTWVSSCLGVHLREEACSQSNPDQEVSPPFGVLHPTGNSLLPPFPQVAAKMVQKVDNAQASPQGRQPGPSVRMGHVLPPQGTGPGRALRVDTGCQRGGALVSTCALSLAPHPRAGKEHDMKSDEDEAALGVTETPASTRRWPTGPGPTWPSSRAAPQCPQCPHFPEPGHGQVILRRHFIDVQSCA